MRHFVSLVGDTGQQQRPNNLQWFQMAQPPSGDLSTDGVHINHRHLGALVPLVLSIQMGGF